MAKLAKNVCVRGVWYGPSYPDAGDPPKGSITNPQCWDGDPPADADDPPAAEDRSPTGEGVGPPPKSGKGATDEAWTAYARRHNVQVEDSMSRSEVIAACEAAGVPTK